MNDWDRMWVIPEFKKFMYRKKAEDPKKTFRIIQKDIIEELDKVEEKTIKTNVKKNKKYWPDF